MAHSFPRGVLAQPEAADFAASFFQAVRRFALTRNDAPLMYGRPRPAGGNISLRVFDARRPSDRSAPCTASPSHPAARPFLVQALLQLQIVAAAVERSRRLGLASPATILTPHSSRPRSSANIVSTAASRLRRCCSHLVVAREEREQLQRNDRCAPEEKLDHRRVRERVARKGLDILHLLLSDSPVKRSSGASATTAQMSRSTASRRGAPAPGRLGWDAADPDGASPMHERDRKHRSLGGVEGSRCVVIDGYFHACNAMLVVHDCVLRLRARP